MNEQEPVTSYPKVYTLGYPETEGVFEGDIIAEEKIDGSQVSFRIVDGVVKLKSRRKQVELGTNKSMFKPAESGLLVRQSKLNTDYTYRGEFLRAPRHNVLAYERVPKDHIIIYDIEDKDGVPLCRDPKAAECKRIDYECVPYLILDMEGVDMGIGALLDTPSILGGKIEGIVIKNYGKAPVDGKGSYMLAKVVSEEFKETRKVKTVHPKVGIISVAAQAVSTDAKFLKAIQHLSDDGSYRGSMSDLGNLIKELLNDINEEDKALLKDIIYLHNKSSVEKAIINNFVSWYKVHIGTVSAT